MWKVCVLPPWKVVDRYQEVFCFLPSHLRMVSQILRLLHFFIAGVFNSVFEKTRFKFLPDCEHYSHNQASSTTSRWTKGTKYLRSLLPSHHGLGDRNVMRITILIDWGITKHFSMYNNFLQSRHIDWHFLRQGVANRLTAVQLWVLTVDVTGLIDRFN